MLNIRTTSSGAQWVACGRKYARVLGMQDACYGSTPVKALALGRPKRFSPRANHTLDCLGDDAVLFYDKGKYILAKHSRDLLCKWTTGYSLDEIEEWLEWVSPAIGKRFGRTHWYTPYPNLA